MTIHEVRKVIGKKYEDLSDDEIITLRDNLTLLAEMFIDNMVSNTKRGVIDTKSH